MEEMWKERKPKRDIDGLQGSSNRRKYEVLTEQIRAWQSLRSVFIPKMHVAQQVTEEDDDGEMVMPWDINLHLPSSVLASNMANCPAKLKSIKSQLRLSQAQTALDDIRCNIRNQRLYTNRKMKHVAGPGQRSNMHSHAAIDSLRKRLSKYVQRYKSARNALQILLPGGAWQEELKVLEDGDL